MRQCALSPQRANALGAHAAEAENQIRFAATAFERGDLQGARKNLWNALERCQIIRQECYYDDHERNEEHSHSPI